MYRRKYLFCVCVFAGLVGAASAEEWNLPEISANNDECFSSLSSQDLSPAAEVASPIQDAIATEFAYSDLLIPMSQRYGVDWRLVAAIIKVESNFNKQARSYAGARGLMQLMPRTAWLFRVSESELYNPARNLEAGIQYLRLLSQRFHGDLPLVLGAYNSGEYAVARDRGVPRCSRGFVRKVLFHYSANKATEARLLASAQLPAGDPPVTSAK